MLKKTIAISLVLGLVSTPAFAQDDELPDASIDVELAFVSNYLFRGSDLFANRAVQKGESLGSHTGAWAFQPSVTFNTPVSGLYFNIWGSFAMQGRTDQDVDRVLQTSPGGADLTSAGSVPLASAYTSGLPTSLNAAVEAQRAGATAGLPGYYAEANGLERLDEIDLTIGYAAETTVGTMGFGYVAYTLVNDRYPGNSGFDEIFFSYALPQLPELGLTVYTVVDGLDYTDNQTPSHAAGAAGVAADVARSTPQKSSQYIDLTYSSGFEVAENISLDYSFGAGYGRQERVQALRDLHAGITLNAYGFFVGYNVVQRQDWRFFDTDAIGTDDGNIPAWVVGRSTSTDGLVGDPGQTTGPINTTFNSNIATLAAATSGVSDYGAASGGAATYTPRQKLPRTLWYVTVGYGFSI
ncbi:MAG: hypothetical protein H7A21_17295 [Spirochaetales bacterium]|nr:hypothetical protein [Leptospiraceae bacterium]MCP5483197.1 hypothetical protein [Spirochaetales bacterium]MCP5486701.1 hypothetical protein [Spirochaetales bacterium]